MSSKALFKRQKGYQPQHGKVAPARAGSSSQGRDPEFDYGSGNRRDRRGAAKRSPGSRPTDAA